MCGKHLLTLVPEEAGQTATHWLSLNQKTLSSILTIRLIAWTRLLEQDHGRRVFTEQPTKHSGKTRQPCKHSDLNEADDWLV